jgi:hypothetical protein
LLDRLPVLTWPWQGGNIIKKRIDLLTKDPENWVLLLLGVLGIIFVIQTTQYSFAAALFPKLVNIVLASLCIFRLAINISHTFAGQARKEEQEPENRAGLPWYWSFVITILYFVTIYLIGFVFATGLFFVALPIAAGYRRWAIIFLVAIFMAIFTEVCFNYFLEMQLPQGILFR